MMIWIYIVYENIYTVHVQPRIAIANLYLM